MGTNLHVQIEKEVGFMTDPTATFVSVVSRGANQTPFRIVKSQEGASEKMRVIQSLLVPKSMSQEDVLAVVGDDLKAAVKFDHGVETSKYTTFEQHPKTAFKEQTLELVVLDEASGLRGLVGEAKEETAKGMLGKLFTKKSEVVAVADDVSAISPEQAVKSMDWEVYDELYALSDAVRGILGQEMGEASAKVGMVKTVLDNFAAFLDVVVTATKGQKMEVPAFEKQSNKEENMAQEVTAPAEDAQKTEAVEPTPAAVEVEQKQECGEDCGTCKTEDAEAKGCDKNKKKAEAAEALKAEVAAQVAPLMDAIKALAEKMESVGETVGKMQNLVPGAVTATSTDPMSAKKSAQPTFKGTIFKS